jgi:hypothetical protein
LEWSGKRDPGGQGYLFPVGLGSGDSAFFNTFGADIDSAGVAFDKDAHFLKIRQKFTHADAGDLASRTAFFLILTFSDYELSR